METLKPQERVDFNNDLTAKLGNGRINSRLWTRNQKHQRV